MTPAPAPRRFTDPAGFFRDRRVLVTGGAGFIGSNLVRHLLALDARVIAVDNLSPGLGGDLRHLAGLGRRLRFVRADLRAAAPWPSLLRNVACVFSLAGRSGHLDSLRRPATDLADNCLLSLRLLEACRHHAPEAVIVHAGTRQIYGRTDGSPVDESRPPAPVDVNGVHKLAADLHHVVYQQVHGLRTRVLRLTNTYGPRMRIRDARLNFLGDWVRRSLAGRDIEVWDGRQRRDYAYVDDVCDAFVRLAATPALDGRIFNLGGSGRVTLLQLARLLLAASSGPGRPLVLPLPPERQSIDLGHHATDDRRFRRATGWAPAIPLRQGLALTVAHFRRESPRTLP